MESFEAETVVLAGSDTVWDIITDGGNYPVWDSGIVDIRGDVRHGETIQIRTPDGGKRTFRLRVRQVPGQVMTWSGGLPLGLLRVKRTFTLTEHAGLTLLAIKLTASGPLRGLVRRALPGITAALAQYVSAVKFRAELLGAHLEKTR